MQLFAHGLGAAAEIAAHVEEGLWSRTLKAVDRLLDITDRENGAMQSVAGAAAAEEFLGQGGHHRPLVGTGILRFIHRRADRSYSPDW